MEPARSIIQKLGGEAKVSEITGTAFTAPYRWQHPRDKGGSDGRIPQKHISVLLEYAKANQIELDLQDFFPKHPVAEAPTNDDEDDAVAPEPCA